MPHLHLETTADLPENGAIPDILEALVARLSTFDAFDTASIKVYHTLRVNWAMGTGAAPGFAHLTVAFLSGRTLEQRTAVADAMWDEMRSHFGTSLEEREVQLTVEVREMERETYRK